MTELLAVIGRPIGHSLSPPLYQDALAQQRSGARYIRMRPADAAEAAGLLRAGLFSGFNVTAPLKQDMLAELDQLDPAAAGIAAVNVVVGRTDGLWGYNTDWQGVLGALAATGFAPRDQRAVVLGPGGAGRAAGWALREAGAAEIVLIGRNRETCRDHARRLDLAWAGLDEAAARIRRADVVVNCLPPGVASIEPGWLQAGQCLLDANYHDRRLSDQARRAGCRIASGLDWLLYQAQAAQSLFGLSPTPVPALRRTLARASAPQPRTQILALSGFSGVGKTTVSRELAGRLGWAWIDLDQEVARQAGRDVPTLFREAGEEAFRRLESACLAEALGRGQAVVALGGGAILDEANRRLLAERARVYWLWAPLDLCLTRIDADSRPLLSGADARQRGRTMLEERLAAYAQSADLMIPVAGKTVEQVAGEVEDEDRRSRSG